MNLRLLWASFQQVGQTLCLYLPTYFFIVLEITLFISVSSHVFAEIRMFPTSLVGVQSKHLCKRVGPA